MSRAERLFGRRANHSSHSAILFLAHFAAHAENQTFQTFGLAKASYCVQVSFIFSNTCYLFILLIRFLVCVF